MQPVTTELKVTVRRISGVFRRLPCTSSVLTTSKHVANEDVSVNVENQAKQSNQESTGRFQISFEAWRKTLIQNLINQQAGYRGLRENTATPARLANNWRLTTLRGVLACLFGFLVLGWPDIPLLILVLIFGSYPLLEHSIRIILGLRDGSERFWRWEIILYGLIGFCVGFSAAVCPDAAVLLLLFVTVGWTTAMGGLKVAEAIRLRHELDDMTLYCLDGLQSFAFGALVASLPVSREMAITWLIGTYALLFGIMLLVLAFRLYVIQTDFNAKTT